MIGRAGSHDCYSASYRTWRRCISNCNIAGVCGIAYSQPAAGGYVSSSMVGESKSSGPVSYPDSFAHNGWKDLDASGATVQITNEAEAVPLNRH